MTRGGPPRLVALRALKLGDFLTGIPALRGLARAFPEHHRTLVAPSVFSPFRTETGMDELHDSFDLAPLDASLSRPDVAVDLHGRGPESQRLLLALAPRRLISFRHEDLPATAGHPLWRPDEHEVRRWCRMLTESGVAADPDDLRIDTGRLPASPAPGATVVHPGAASGSRRWPPRRFAAVARAESARGRRVVVTGGADERRLATGVAEMAGLPGESVLAGTTSLVEMAALVAGAGRVVCGDTGVAHLATATATPSVVLFGPVPPSEWGPPTGQRHIALWAGRRGDPHGPQVDPGLLGVSVAQVLAALDRLEHGPVHTDVSEGTGEAAGVAWRLGAQCPESWR